MKKLLNPGFEFMFALGIVVIFMMPLFVMAKQHKQFKVTVSNNDTTINGKKIKDLSPGECKEVLKNLDDLSFKVAGRH